MKKSPLYIISAVLIMATLFSCSIEKRLYNKGYSVEWNKKFKSSENTSVVQIPEINLPDKDVASVSLEISKEEPKITVTDTIRQPLCDSIKMVNGETKAGIVQEVGVSEIKYKNCDGSGPLYVLEKKTVKQIRYSNGKEDIISTPIVSSTPAQKPKEKRAVEGIGIVAFVCSIVAIFFAGIPLSIAAIILGFISIGKIANYPSKFKGAAFGILAVIFGLIILIVTIAILL